MSTKITRGQMLVFTAAPTDENGAAVTPSTINLYVNYKHADGTISTDAAIPMTQQTDGSFLAEFDTGDCLPGKLFASIQADDPAAAQDFTFDITANPANPAP